MAQARTQPQRSTAPTNAPTKLSLGYSPFHAAAEDYFNAGYLPIPLPFGKKSPPPAGTPNELEVTESLIEQWCTQYQTHRNIGTIVPDDIVVIDIDGAAARENIIELERRYGKLPATWMSFRGNPDRYHMWYRTPPDLVWPGKLAAGVDIIYRHYRFMVLPPSMHPDGEQYRWANLGRKNVLRASVGYFPGLDEFSDIPDAWWENLANAGGYVHRERAEVDARLWLTEHGTGDMCPEMKRVLLGAQRTLRKHADQGGMHDAMVNGVWGIVAEISNGHTGGDQGLKRFKSTFYRQAEESGRREDGAAQAEWTRACLGAIEKTAIEHVRIGDPCKIEEAERSQNPDRFFDPKHGLKARSLRRAVEVSGRLAVGPGQAIYRYTEGLWTPDGQSEIYRRTESLLRQRWRPSHAANVETVVKHRLPLIEDDNQDTAYLNLPNGLLEWQTGRLYPHNPNVISTTRIPIPWDDEAECPAIDQFFQEVFPGDATELAYEILGYMLYNDNPLHKAILLYGSGRNGKGTFIRLARMLVGHNNISAVTPQDLDSSQFSSAQLYGKLANLVGDVDPRIFKSTEKFKQLTGGDYMMAQHKHQHPFTFRCRALMVAAFNSLPRTADTTEGFFSRWVVIPFTAFFPAGVANPTLVDALTRPQELQGLLRYAVAGLGQVMRRGSFTMPASVVKATERFKAEADPIRGFIEERIRSVADRNAFIPRTELYMLYGSWAAINGFHQMSAMRFYEAFITASVEALHNPVRVITLHGITGYRGLAIK